MNPQAFGNMGGMGRGMPNMGMMGGNTGVGMGMNNMNQSVPQQKGPNFLAIIYQTLTTSQSQDGPLQGWRQQVAIQDRAAQIKILFDNLRLLGTQVDTKRSLDIALAFERRQFSSTASMEAYKKSIHDKLASIRDQRQQQVNGNNPGQAGMMMNSSMSQPQMQQQQMNMDGGMVFPQAMQPSPMGGQMPQSMNVSLITRVIPLFYCFLSLKSVC